MAANPPRPTTDGPTPPISFVTCVESGQLEDQVILMVESLRRFGGRFANCPMIAVEPRRFRVPLESKTRKALDRLGVQVVPGTKGEQRYGWWGFMNKPMSLLKAKPHIATPLACWVDGDILFAHPPEELVARLDEDDFGSCVEDMGPVSTGPDHDFDTFWARLAQTIGMPLDQIPYVMSPAHRRIRIYFNGGVFRYRMGVGYEEMYQKTVEDLLDARFVPRLDPSIFLFEQISVGLAAARLGLRIRELPPEYNFHIESVYEQIYPISSYKQAVLFHYHRAFHVYNWDVMLAKLRGERPDLAALVEAHRPHTSTLRKLRSIPQRLFSRKVGVTEATHLASCERI